MINIEPACDLLAADDAIEFALLFGSFARGNPRPWSDVDIAIFVAQPLDLLEVGQLTAALERSVGRTVDLLVLNTAIERNPALAYNVIREGSLLFCRRHETFVDCKTKIMLQYLDTAFLRAMVERALAERLKTGRFGTGGCHA